jgi:hypothetical protein
MDNIVQYFTQENKDGELVITKNMTNGVSYMFNVNDDPDEYQLYLEWQAKQS